MLYNNRNMNRPQRTVKAPTRLIEEDTPTPKRTSAPKRTLHLDIPKSRGQRLSYPRYY